MNNVFDVADYFLRLQHEDAEDFISNLKLQKLCYYAQGISLALSNCRLFDNDILAWQHGSAIEKLYNKYKKFNGNNLHTSDDFNINSLSNDTRNLLDCVYEEYGQYSAWRLRCMNHCESPWKLANISNSKIISDKNMKNFFKTQVSWMDNNQHIPKNNVFDVAKYILLSIGGNVSTMKLQKLCYYSQAWNLVWEEKPLFNEEFYAFQNSVICKELFKLHEGMFYINSKDIDDKYLKNELGEIERLNVEQVLEDFGEYTGVQLSEMSHLEKPYQQTQKDKVISKDSMKNFYSSLN